MMIGVLESLRIWEVLGICRRRDAIWREADGNNAMDLLEAKYSPPWLLQVRAEGVADLGPELAVIDSVWIKT